MNQITHWLDASQVYGSSQTDLIIHRSGYLLKTDSTVTNRQHLHTSSTPRTCAQPSPCPVAGDSRVSENPMLTVMHTLWMREHNRIARQLAAFNPTWNAETVFQETKRIVTAELQHITYNEYLPAILGKCLQVVCIFQELQEISHLSAPQYMDQYGLRPLSSGYFTGYQPTINPLSSGPISNEMAAAAFRMGHTMVKDFIL